MASTRTDRGQLASAEEIAKGGEADKTEVVETAQ